MFADNKFRDKFADRNLQENLLTANLRKKCVRQILLTVIARKNFTTATSETDLLNAYSGKHLVTAKYF
jgi:hypothetical protein